MKMVIKATYTKSRGAAKATLRYITHRPGKDGARTTREILGIDGALDKAQAYRLIDEAKKGSSFFRIVISPDPEKEDTNRDLYLAQITTHTMLKLEDTLQIEVPFIAVEHNDHTAHRHVHVLASVSGRLNSTHFKLLREAATQAAITQRQERDLALAQKARIIEEVQWAI